MYTQPPKTETQEVRSKQNLMFRRWMIFLVVFAFFGAVLILLVSLANGLGLKAKGSVDLDFARIDVGTGEQEQVSQEQVQEVESQAQDPNFTSVNTQFESEQGYCVSAYSFAMYPEVPYGPIGFEGYYLFTDGLGSFGVLDPFGNVAGYGISENGQWTDLGMGIEVCADSTGSYARY